MADSHSDSNSAPFVPQSPFDDRNADVILTSSDGIDFHVQRAILSLVSSFFNTMFTLPQPGDDPEVPSISMAESAVVLDRVLRFCYPGAEAVVDSISHLQEILELSLIKYDIQFIVPVAKKYLQTYVDDQPVAAFAIACRYKWEDLAMAAARRSLALPIRSFDLESPPELEYITAKDYHTLLKYHIACATAATNTTTDLRWITGPPNEVWFRCTNCASQTYKWYLSDGEPWRVRDWFLAYMKAVKKILKRQPLAKADDPKLMHAAVKGMADCYNCRAAEGFAQLQRFATDRLGPRITSEIDKVVLDLKF
ncbi:hypothetical protein B0H11DRAFT_1338868 [Mycena galericulata]|nr:hypothetical protein B0H11DRAFT_1338868 [Mycena galericulata]